MVHRSFFKRPKSLTSFLIGFGAVIVLAFLGPLVLIAGQYTAGEKSRLVAAAERQNAELLRVLQEKMARDRHALRSLTRSPAFDEGFDPALFNGLSQALLPGVAMSVVETGSWQELYRTRATTERRTAPLQLMSEALATDAAGRFPVSDLLPPRGTMGYAVAMSEFVMAGKAPASGDAARNPDDARYIVTGFWPADGMADLIANRPMMENTVGVLVDRRGQIIARTDGDAAKTGQILPGFSAIDQPKGSWSGINPQGISVYGFWNRDETTGWTLTTGTSGEILEAPIWRALTLLGTFGILFASLFAVALWWLGRSLKLACSALTKAARALQDDGEVEVPELPVTEANEIGQSIKTASTVIREQARSLEEARSHLEARIEERTAELQTATRRAEEAEQKALAANRELALVATTDAVTGLPNRLCFETVLQAELVSPDRLTSPLSLLLVDIDNFKRVNESHGHQTGDEVLRALSIAVKTQLRRSSDALFRLGGEEFAVLLPNTDAQAAFSVAERIRETVSTTMFVPAIPQGQVTISIGLAGAVPEGESPASLCRKAAGALAGAKRTGRNTVCTDRDVSSTSASNIFEFRAS